MRARSPIASNQGQGPSFQRRTILGAIPATILLAACGEDPIQFGSQSDSLNIVDHGLWDQLVSEYVLVGDDGLNLFEYERLQTEARDQLSAYLTAMQAVSVETLGRDEQYAFWVNLYNAATIDVILQNYPVDSIRDIGLLGLGPWKDEVVTVSGRPLSLDNIEHDILRPGWQDVRIHYAVNCASIGCPNLAARAYTSENLEEMLEAAAATFINHPRGFDYRDGEIVASSIFDWYQGDWGDASDVLEHAREYATGETSEFLADAAAIGSYEYDWTLNEA